MNLYIIGNGFDMAHGLSTSYMDFRNYLENVDWEYLIRLEAPYNCVPESRREWIDKCLWREFESNLSSINETEIIDGGTSLELGLESGDVGIEDTLNVYWEEQYGYIQRLNDYIKSWAEQIDIQVPKKTKQIKRHSDDLFISFNYTLLLEKVYEIDPYQILHIHGSVNEENDPPPVIGHGNADKIREAKEKAHNASENFWEKETSIYNALANYYESTLKDVRYYLCLHSHFFERLKPVEQVFVIGHSFGNVDLPYFKKVLESIQGNAVWIIYYHNDIEAATFTDKITSVGLKTRNLKMLSSSTFFNKT